jgi:acyl dehydratase
MPLDYQTVKNWPFSDVTHTYSEKDTILYALGIGFGADPLDREQLRFVYEKDLRVVPSMAVVLGYAGQWHKDPKSTVDWVKILHGDQTLRVHRPLPPSGTVVGRTRILAVVDKGKGKGALIVQERKISDQASGELLATLTYTSFARGDGGFSERSGVSDASPAAPAAVPESAAELSCDLPTLPQSALIYRLCADMNPLHADPDIAKAAGFPKPILHGLCTYGVACHAILKSVCDYEPTRLKSLFLRFSSPVFPGETIRTEMWRRDGKILFRSRVLERDVVVLNNGVAEIA